MQTTVEWLVEEMLKQGYFDANKPLTFTNLDHLQQQAKEMEKQQIIDAYANGEDNVDNDGCTISKDGAETYFAETYESKGSDECNEINWGGVIQKMPISSQTEISDEEIEKGAKDFVLSHDFSAITTQNHLANRCFQLGIKWYREQLKNKL